MHRRLAGTIADASNPWANLSGTEDMRIMACHEHPVGEEAHCIGWLHNQVGVGNNIALRLSLRHCENAHLIRIDGEQHERFEDTLPEGAFDASKD